MESCVPGRYQTLRTIPEFECDFNLRLTAGGLLRLVQEVSTRHCTLLGITMERYQQTHTAFLLAKLCARVYEDIPAGTEMAITSLPSSPIRAVYHRYTTLSLPDGRTAAAVDARWMLVDTQSRRILRRAPEELGLPFDMAAVPELPIRITRPQEELLPAGEEVACYSRCDQNRHMNNTRYADIICDRLPLERLEAGPVRELCVSYHREVPMGRALRLFSRETAPGEYYFLGKEGEQDCFEATLSFAEKE